MTHLHWSPYENTSNVKHVIASGDAVSQALLKASIKVKILFYILVLLLSPACVCCLRDLLQVCCAVELDSSVPSGQSGFPSHTLLTAIHCVEPGHPHSPG